MEKSHKFVLITRKHNEIWTNDRVSHVRDGASVRRQVRDRLVYHGEAKEKENEDKRRPFFVKKNRKK